jgi:hypothetical protein
MMALAARHITDSAASGIEEYNLLPIDCQIVCNQPGFV